MLSCRIENDAGKTNIKEENIFDVFINEDSEFAKEKKSFENFLSN